MEVRTALYNYFYYLILLDDHKKIKLEKNVDNLGKINKSYNMSHFVTKACPHRLFLFVLK